MVSAPLMYRQSDLIAEALAKIKLLPFRVEQMAMLDMFEMQGECQAFDEIEPGEILPEYRLIVEQGKNGEIESMDVQRVEY